MAEDFRDEYGNDAGFRNAIVEELANLEVIGHRIGGGFTAGPIRHRVGEQVFVLGWQFEYHNAPMVQQREPAPDVELAEPDPEPEPVAAEG